MYEGIKLAVLGCGKWGINHIKTAYEILGDNLIAVCDINKDHLEAVHKVNPGIKFCNKFEKLVKDTDINTVIIATPAETHYELAKYCLTHGKNLLVEKPISLLSEETKDLIEIAEKSKVFLMVGHVLLYHPAILKIKENIDNGLIGSVQYIYSNRLNLGQIRKEENILWSFAPHDISIIQFLLEKYPTDVYAKGCRMVQNNIEDSTITYLVYPDNIHAHIFVSWLHPFKEHRLVVIGDKGMFVFEDTLKREKLKFYRKGFSVVDGEIEKFDSDFEIMNYEDKQPLKEEQKHFFECILENKKPRTDGDHALAVLLILEQAQESLKNFNDGK
ncbi:MAG: Gfo/Idh/MocA family oxidoreductase [Ignavibacteria bacterium]|jgi:UDP-2-acetamido-3-amino-2,3-dideoxy-glucuronate N-acetyltransferase|nr:Gfo/Idh/MocA family oxidoreductase [Ignavibacteria bacterium]